MTICKPSIAVFVPAAACLLSGCNGILGGIYDEAGEEFRPATPPGELYIDASDWNLWHYIDFHALAQVKGADPEADTASLWTSFGIPTAESPGSGGRDGIYTYWYDVYGEGISRREFRDFMPTASQPEPEEWTIAVHRNNVRTNGCAVARTGLNSLEELTSDPATLENLVYHPDEWNETDVWMNQDRMLSGIIGNQGININTVLSSWLSIDIPPMPPSFTLNDEVFVIRLTDGSFGALQLHDYQSPAGIKCCLSIRYRYPL